MYRLYCSLSILCTGCACQLIIKENDDDDDDDDACIDLHQTRSVGEGSDHLQLIKFWPSCAPGKGSAAGRNFLAPPYDAQYMMYSMCVSITKFLSLTDSRYCGVP